MTPKFKRTRTLVLFGVLVLLVWGALQAVPLIFDLNTYKGYLQARLSKALSCPVELGQVRLSLLRGVRVQIQGFRILAEEGGPVAVQARKVSAGIKLLPLLRRELILHRVTVDEPYARLWRDSGGRITLWKAGSKPEPPSPPERRLPVNFAISDLLVKDGAVEFMDESDVAEPITFHIRAIDAFIRLNSPGGSSFVKIAAEVWGGDKPARVVVTAEVEPQPGGEGSPPLRASGHLRCVGVDVEQFWKYCRSLVPLRQLRGTFDIEADFAFDGRHRFEVADGRLHFTDLFIDYPKAFRTPFVTSVGNLQWEMAYDGGKLDFLVEDLDLDGMRLRGRFAVDHIHSPDERSLEAEFSAPVFPLREKLRYFPTALLPERALRYIEEKIHSGMLEIKEARISGKIQDIRKIRDHPGVLMVEAAGTGFSVSFSKNVYAEGLNFAASLNEGTLGFHVDAGILEGVSIRSVEGEVASLFRGQMLTVQGTADLSLSEIEGALPRWVPSNSRWAFLQDLENLQGSALAHVSWKRCWGEKSCGDLSGTLDLVDAAFEHPRFPMPVSSANGRIEFSRQAVSFGDFEGTVGRSPTRLTLDIGDLNTEHPTYEATFWSNLAGEDLPSLVGPLFPGRLQVQGFSAWSGSLRGNRQGLRMEVEADLTDASYEYTGIFRKPAAKANTLSFAGSAVKGEGVVVDEMVFRLGSSTITATGTVSGLANPMVSLVLSSSACVVADFSERNPYWKPHYPVAGTVRGELRLDGPLGQPGGLVRSMRADLADLHMVFPALEQPVFIRQAKLKYADGELAFDPLEVVFGKSLFQASGRMEKSDRPHLVLEVHGDSVNWEDLRVFRGKSAGGVGLDFLKRLRLDAQVLLDALRFKHVTFQKFRAHLISDGGDQLNMSNIWFNVGRGKVIAHAALNLDGSGRPRIEISDVEAIGLDVDHLLDAARPEGALLTGFLSASAEDLQIVENGSASMLAGLNGGFTLRIVDGTLKRYKTLAMIFSIMNFHKILQDGFPSLGSKGLDFHSIEGSFLVRDGVLRTDDLLLDSNAMRIRVMGGVNLPARRFEPLKELQESYSGLNGMLVMVQPFYTVDSILSRLPFIDFIAGDNRTLLCAFFEVSGPTDSPEVRSLQIQSLEAGVKDRLKKLLRGGMRLLMLSGEDG